MPYKDVIIIINVSILFKLQLILVPEGERMSVILKNAKNIVIKTSNTFVFEG